MEVMMREPRNSQIHVSQAVPGASPLTWNMEGDPDINKVSFQQNIQIKCNMLCYTYILFCLDSRVSERRGWLQSSVLLP